MMLLKIITILIICILMCANALAHMMVAQHGTINIVDKGAFMVLSLPVSAFEGLDMDNDGKASSAELTRYKNQATELIHENVQLSDSKAKLPLQGLIISLASHGNPKKPSSHLIVMGKYPLDNINGELTFTNRLFGRHLSEQQMDMTITRQHDKQKQTVIIDKDQSSKTLLNASAD
ncbi:hypothetical protein A9267_14745 [Shewanella sp. UCD-FRSSP16_17]|uniref:hypothetical protein n=1 Tax=unclassified Shewanella TaxID=196818 RepID=UPI0007EEE3C2|nr:MULTISPECIES: hypothetical protein [unclassified Shewanella]MBQ4891569.1 hypothetical protein [Shewanella sp. MMG014]OBT07121.1 hypothetical protein A9267_14745 [Shewanella sp. UCD-FRSSP16_17]